MCAARTRSGFTPAVREQLHQQFRPGDVRVSLRESAGGTGLAMGRRSDGGEDERLPVAEAGADGAVSVCGVAAVFEAGGQYIQFPPFPCESFEEIVRPRGAIPRHLPGTNKFLDEFPTKHGIPPQAARGGAETMYPKYQDRIRRTATAPKADAK